MLKAHNLGRVEEGILIASVLMDICVKCILAGQGKKEKHPPKLNVLTYFFIFFNNNFLRLSWKSKAAPSVDWYKGDKCYHSFALAH